MISCSFRGVNLNGVVLDWVGVVTLSSSLVVSDLHFAIGGELMSMSLLGGVDTVAPAKDVALLNGSADDLGGMPTVDSLDGVALTAVFALVARGGRSDTINGVDGSERAMPSAVVS